MYHGVAVAETGILNKTDLSHILHDVLDLPPLRHGHLQETRILNTILKVIANALRSGDEVLIEGFGIFRREHRRSRCIGNTILTTLHDGTTFRDPTPYLIPAKDIITFHPAIPLSAMVNLDNPTYEQRRSMQTWKPEES